MMMLLLSLSVLGCISRTHDWVCEVVSETEISDEEETVLGSPSQLLEQLVQEQTVPAVWADGGETAAQVHLSRGAGSAVFAEMVSVERVTEYRQLGSSTDFYPYTSGSCIGRLDLPLRVGFRTEDGGMDLELPGAVTLWETWLEAPPLHVTASRELAAGELPIFEQDPTDFENPVLHATVLSRDGALKNGQLSWTAVSADGSELREMVLALEGPS
jgi:hypothetical protein